MTLRILFYSLFLCVALVCAPDAAPSQEKAATQPVKQPDPDALMKEYLKISQPGPAHKHFERYVGTWTYTMKTWLDPEKPPTESTGTCEYKLLFGGRYLVQEFHGSFMGQPFEGMGITGYDNFRKQYASVWMDNLGTAVLNSAGQFDPATKTITLTGLMDEPLTGEKNKQFRTTDRFLDDNTGQFEMYDTIPGKGEIKVMAITYTRKK